MFAYMVDLEANLRFLQIFPVDMLRVIVLELDRQSRDHDARPFCTLRRIPAPVPWPSFAELQFEPVARAAFHCSL